MMTATFIVKVLISLLLMFIMFQLAYAFYFMVVQKKRDHKMVRALSWRVGLSFFLFVLLFVFYALGWLRPHGIGPVTIKAEQQPSLLMVDLNRARV